MNDKVKLRAYVLALWENRTSSAALFEYEHLHQFLRQSSLLSFWFWSNICWSLNLLNNAANFHKQGAYFNIRWKVNWRTDTWGWLFGAMLAKVSRSQASDWGRILEHSTFIVCINIFSFHFTHIIFLFGVRLTKVSRTQASDWRRILEHSLLWCRCPIED